MPIFAGTSIRLLLLNRLKNARTIFLKGLFFVVAIQVLYLSIVMNLTACNTLQLQSFNKGNDICCFTGFIIERIFADNKYIPEDQDADNNADTNNMAKYETSPLYAEQISNQHIVNCINSGSPGMTGTNLANKISKGYINIISPPPKLV